MSRLFSLSNDEIHRMMHGATRNEKFLDDLETYMDACEKQLNDENRLLDDHKEGKFSQGGIGRRACELIEQVNKLAKRRIELVAHLNAGGYNRSDNTSTARAKKRAERIKRLAARTAETNKRFAEEL